MAKYSQVNTNEFIVNYLTVYYIPKKILIVCAFRVVNNSNHYY